jgi:hypothetical protein
MPPESAKIPMATRALRPLGTNQVPGDRERDRAGRQDSGVYRMPEIDGRQGRQPSHGAGDVEPAHVFPLGLLCR